MNFFCRLLDVILPYRCIGCGDLGLPLCRSCISKLPLAEKHASSWINGFFSYKYPATKDTIQHLKKYPNQMLIKTLVEESSHELACILSDKVLFGTFKSPIIVPIPIHYSRFLSRGYNQSEYIAKALHEKLSEGWNTEYNNTLLVKTKKTQKQALITEKSLRLAAPKGSIAVRREAQNLLMGRDVVLIDDVATTGATLAAAKVALLQSGARHVIAFTIAH
jgi:ComF family protein